MKSLLKLCVVLFTCMTAVAFGKDVLLPSDLRVEKPSAEVPAACSAFFSETGWGQGKWSGVLPNQVWVEKINTDCSVQVVYAWGDAPSWRMSAGFERVTGVISDNKLQLVLKEANPKVTATYTLSEDGKSLSGLWKSVGQRGEQSARVQLIKGPAL